MKKAWRLHSSCFGRLHNLKGRAQEIIHTGDATRAFRVDDKKSAASTLENIQEMYQQYETMRDTRKMPSGDLFLIMNVSIALNLISFYPGAPPSPKTLMAKLTADKKDVGRWIACLSRLEEALNK